MKRFAVSLSFCRNFDVLVEAGPIPELWAKMIVSRPTIVLTDSAFTSSFVILAGWESSELNVRRCSVKKMKRGGGNIWWSEVVVIKLQLL